MLKTEFEQYRNETDLDLWAAQLSIDPRLVQRYTVSQKVNHCYLYDNFRKCEPIFTFFTVRNFTERDCRGSWD